jgi:hypothetical protein
MMKMFIGISLAFALALPALLAGCGPMRAGEALEAQATRRVLLENCKLVTKREDLRL